MQTKYLKKAKYENSHEDFETIINLGKKTI